MKTLIIYDDLGCIIMQVGGSYRVPHGGVQYLEIELPQNKIVTGVKIEGVKHTPMIEDIPKTDIEIAQERIQALEESNAELITLISMQGQNA